MSLAQAEHPARWYTTNLVGVPAPWLASPGFNARPQALHIAGTRAAHRGLFALLERAPTLDESRAVFAHYMGLSFGLGKPPRESAPDGGAAPRSAEARRWRCSYLKLLQGWALDANGGAGAVLKGWIESRFGLVPRFHEAPLERFPSAAWMRYLEQKCSGRWHNNAIWPQLDLLYEYAQWALQRHAPLGPGPCVRLWRGSTRCEEQLVAGSLAQRRCTVRLNNIVSLSRSREDAECFGDWIFTVELPLAKVLVFPGLLDSRAVHGEDEVIALGGDFEVEARYDGCHD